MKRLFLLLALSSLMFFESGCSKQPKTVTLFRLENGHMTICQKMYKQSCGMELSDCQHTPLTKPDEMEPIAYHCLHNVAEFGSATK